MISAIRLAEHIEHGLTFVAQKKVKESPHSFMDWHQAQRHVVAGVLGIAVIGKYKSVDRALEAGGDRPIYSDLCALLGLEYPLGRKLADMHNEKSAKQIADDLRAGRITLT